MQILKNTCFNNNLLFKVAKTILSEQLIQPEDEVIAAVSGGPDSIALLHMLYMLKPNLFRKLGVAHLNHGIRAHEADRDAEFVNAFCQKLDVPFFSSKVNAEDYARKNRMNLEEAGRVCRYDFFESILKNEGYTKIATGHHSDDNAELILMCLIRGSGPLGISGMPMIRENTYIRPLLEITHNEIMEYCNANHLQFVSDSSNDDIKFTRNRIRHRLLPCLKQNYNPNVVTALNTLAIVTRSENEWMSEITETYFASVIIRKKMNKVTLSNTELRKMHQALIRRVLRRALAEINGELKRIGLRHIEALTRLIFNEKGYQQLNLPNNITVERINDQLQISSHQSKVQMHKWNKLQSSTIIFNYNAKRPKDKPVQIHISEIDCYLKFSIIDQEPSRLLHEAGQNVAFFDMDRLTFPLYIRNSKPGDRFSPLGLNGTQKLKDFFINIKIPRTMRKRIPIVESGNSIIWIAGYRCSHFSRITSETRHILKAEFFLPNT